MVTDGERTRHRFDRFRRRLDQTRLNHRHTELVGKDLHDLAMIDVTGFDQRRNKVFVWFGGITESFLKRCTGRFNRFSRNKAPVDQDLKSTHLNYSQDDISY